MEPSIGQQEIEDVIGVVEGADIGEAEAASPPEESGVQIGPGPEQVKEGDADSNVGLELGDLIEVHSNRADMETVRGRIYYIDDSRMSILEDGKSRKLIVIDFEEDDDGDFVPKEEYELTGIEIKEKRLLPSFVAQRGMAKDMLAETFTADGDPLATYKIKTVNEVEDSAIFVDDAGEELVLQFQYKGIPSDRSAVPFDVLRVIEPPNAEIRVPNEAAAGEVEEEFLDFEFLDDMVASEVEELSGLFQATQRPAWQILYTDDEQLNDMLRQQIQELDPAAQKNPRRIRAVTRLVWNLLSLRNDITKYSGDKPVGRKSTAYQTLVELLSKTTFPLAKQILSVAKSIYVDHGADDLEAHLRGNTVDPTSVSDPQIILHYLQDTVLKGNRYLESQLKDNAPSMAGGAAVGAKIPRWLTIWQGFFNKYFEVISPIREDEDVKDVRIDQDFFRSEVPKSQDEGNTLSGFPVLLAGDKSIVSATDLGTIRFSYMRALGPRFGRYGEGGFTHKIEDADSAEINGHLIFPLEFLRDLGYIRSGILAYDMAHALQTPMSMKRILDKAGSIVDVPEAGKIISVNFDGSTLGNTEIADWLKGQALYGGGIGDLMPPLRSFGLLQAEFTVSQKLVLDSKINLYNAAVKKMIKDSRDSIVQSRVDRKPIRTNSLLSDQDAYEMFKRATSAQTGEPLLANLFNDFKLRHPTYKHFDVAAFAYMYLYYPDLLLNTLAQNPDVAKERLRVERDLFIKDVLNKLEGEKKLQDAGEPAQPNPCQHVNDLTKIRKIQNNTERMLSLNKFIRVYKLKKEDHWLWCNNGDIPHHLVCEHEYLLLQEFLRPKEKDVIHKELILTFSGGKFNGQYICKQCGQSIMDYEYDTHLEYDDQGRPMSGRDVLVDEDALEEERLQRALTTEAEEEEKVDVRAEDEQKIYSTLNELANVVGIYPDRKAYEIMIPRVKNALALVPDRTKYSQSQKALKKAGKPSTDYDIFINRILVSLCAGALLIDVQTHIPEYIVRYTLVGCANPEFTGYPRDIDTKKNETGLEYMVCAISSITRKGDPWELTGYQSISSSTARMKEIMLYLKIFTTQLAETPDVQQSIVDKKQYLLETFGYESSIGRPKDIIPSGFTPVPFVVTKELGAEAESPVIAETASESEKVRAYIKQAHLYAKDFGKYLPGSSFSEASCCYEAITTPGEFWKHKGSLPTLPPLESPAGSGGSHLYLPMRPRPLERLSGKADDSVMYRLFLRVCFRGPRIGQQHEPGYDNICPWCELKFSDDPRLPPPTRRFAKDGGKQLKLDAEYESVLQDKQRKDLEALREAGVAEVTKENFEGLLVSVNKRGVLDPVITPEIPTPLENMRGMVSLLPAPFEDYEEVLRETLVALEGLLPDAPRREVINAFTVLSGRTVELENEIRSRLGEGTFLLYQELMKGSPQDLGEALRSYFLVPFQRILTSQGSEPRKFRPLIKASPRTEFSPEVMGDLTEAYKRHTSYLNDITKDIPKSDKYIRAKLKEVVEKLSVVIPVFVKVLRSTVIRGGKLASDYLQRLIVAGVFAEFIMPNHVPSNEPGVVAPTSAITIPAKMPARILQACLLKYRQEGLQFSQEYIKELIQDRIEKEKSEIIKDKSTMTPEQRKLDNMLQRLGMGKWAVGGTKAIWRYDPNQYVSEKEAMDAAGITRFAPEVDIYEAEGGYDVIQTAEDDA